MNNYALPADDRLEQLIQESFELMPGPEMQRLAGLEQRLLRSVSAAKPRQKSNTLPWWLVLLLMGGFATAAWWAGEIIMGGNDKFTDMSGMNEVEQTEPDQNKQDVSEAISEAESEAPLPEPYLEKDSPVIYQREGN